MLLRHIAAAADRVAVAGGIPQQVDLVKTRRL